jgi:DNA-3-methyladenine glycosylase II
MLRHTIDEPGLHAALEALAAADPDVGRALERIGHPQPRVREPGFATLLRIVAAQQLSTKAAAAIWSRLETALGGSVTTAGFLALEADRLRGVGFSLRKAEYGRALARLIEDGALDLVAVAAHEDEAAIQAISKLKGFGRWSAEIYLLFALGRADVFPADDLALQVAFQRLKGLAGRPSGKELRSLVTPWSPWRGAGAIFLWHYYGAATLDAAEPPASRS